MKKFDKTVGMVSTVLLAFAVFVLAGCSKVEKTPAVSAVQEVQAATSVVSEPVDYTVQKEVCGVASGTHTKHFYYVTSEKPDTHYYMWWWNKNGDSNVKGDGAPSSWYSDGTAVYGPDANGWYGLDFNVSYDYDTFGLLFVASVNRETKQTCDYLIPRADLEQYDRFYIVAGDDKYYTSNESFTGLSSVSVVSSDGTTLSARLNGVEEFDASRLSVKTLKGRKATVVDAQFNEGKLTITLSDKDKINIFDASNGYIVFYGNKSMNAEVSDAVKADYIDQNFYYDGDDLGITIKGSNVTFKSWAPLASSVSVLLYKEDPLCRYREELAYKTLPMKKGAQGVWSLTTQAEYGDYYRYKITNDGETNLVSDIWNFCASPDSVASQIVDIRSDVASMPEGWELDYTNPHQGNGYTDNILYEMHVRDWAAGIYKAETGMEWKQYENKDNDCYTKLAESRVFVDYLNELGITHVQILPVFDQAEKNSSGKYNWGYNPYHYNVPEGRYATANYTDGRVAVREFRSLILALHNAGVSVNMDVVYNHTSGTGTGSLYDMTVPKYFYRLKSDGSYSNGSGCGNEIATNHRMVRKYVIASLKHWMQDYHVNGFRFDLMGVHERSTMEEIYNELVKIDPSVMVYGEPWTGGSSAVEDGVSSSGSVGKYGYAVFDDDFRDSIKGAEFGGFGIGQVQEKPMDEYIVQGLTGATVLKNRRNATGNPSLAIHYVECHDNYTLFDKLVYSSLGESVYGKDDIAPEFSVAYEKVMEDGKLLSLVKAQDKLCAAYVLLSQGVPFINGGQEFLRTKMGNPDSYSADKKGGVQWTENAGKYNINSVNTIKLQFADKYADVYNTYRALIAFRKANPDVFGANLDAKAVSVAPFVTLYETGVYKIYFNASSKAYKVKEEGKIVSLNETDGTYSVAEKASVLKSVPAKGFVILKTN